MAALQDKLDAASQALDGIQNSANSQTGTPIDANSWEQALKGLESGKMPFNKSELAGLKNTNLKQLSGEQLKQLQDKLAKDGDTCNDALGKLGENLKKSLKQGKRSSHGKQWGPGGGTESEDLALKEAPTNLKPQKEEGLTNSNLENATVGDTIKTSAGQHKVDPAEYQGPQAAGALTSPGSGGEAVWKQELVPAEREVLKRYYQ